MEIIPESQDTIPQDYQQLLLKDLRSTESQHKIQRMLDGDEKRHSFNVNQFRDADKSLASYVIENPTKCIRFLEENLNTVVEDLTGSDLGKKGRREVTKKTVRHLAHHLPNIPRKHSRSASQATSA